MEKFVTRPYEPGDAAAIADLVNVSFEHVGGRQELTAEMVAEAAGRLGDPRTDTRVVCDADGSLVASGFVQAPPPGGDSVSLQGGVYPRMRGRGLGRDLLAWQLARAGEIHRATAPTAVWQARTGILASDEDASRLLRRFGMEPARYWFDMTAPTVGGPVLEAPAGLQFARYHERHEAALHTAHMDAFAEHWGFQWRDREHWATASVRSSRFLPQLSLLAFDGSGDSAEIAGYVLCYKAPQPDWFYAGQVGVRKPWRRRGLAAAMLSRVMVDACAAGFATSALGVDAAHPSGAVGVYERVGFTVDNRAVTYARALTA